ncbi:MAG: MotA/TolQ/ExbB proton channel family protein [Parvibaculaceae bacterium]|mgnify:CR=1 FL=1|nr:MotA/TolQ/ExbB proton channel family protein [Parvibaculaceae bacterium]|tara:strand:+ start:18591 stop:19385 length:795 start_codon:yes stop_codon:yes gene_type:complete
MNSRIAAALVSIVFALGFLAVGWLLLLPDPQNSFDPAIVLFNNDGIKSPFASVQNIMWIVFFIGLGELWTRWKAASSEIVQLAKSYLPEDDESLLTQKDLGPHYQRIKADVENSPHYLQRLLKQVIMQFQSSRSIDQAHNLMNSNIELYQHEIDMKYNMLKYIVWIIPTLGFIGTVIGIALALGEAGNFPGIDPTDPASTEKVKNWIKGLTMELGVAFYTTLVALVLSAILMFLLNIIQEREEMALNKVGQYCLDNLITRLYVN